MMKQWAYIVDGVLHEIIDDVVEVDGREVPIEERYRPDYVEQLVLYTAPVAGDDE
ncbi:hypothetical protein N7403_30640 [Pseudomonas nitroreducens]|uniref:hypothetical protein n=1 Tax=Pseudomonas nitroreducens TaxID=46680 RepID=UPI00244CB57D|nr:hypothetical protein [Pseudomonas nitroreducens]MDG9858228.1 hypothetical protein [Pseudomonas nitroreducens]